MEDITSRSFIEMSNEMFNTFDMKNSIYETPLPERFHSLITPGHIANGSEVFLRWNNYPENSAASLWTTAEDLNKWALEISRTYNGLSNKYLNRTTVNEMLTPVRNFGLVF
jgi:hypothetical protein